jgi:hypothetical protein
VEKQALTGVDLQTTRAIRMVIQRRQFLQTDVGTTLFEISSGTAITDDRFMKIFVGNGSYFKYSPGSSDYVDIRIKTRSSLFKICFAVVGPPHLDDVFDAKKRNRYERPAMLAQN